MHANVLLSIYFIAMGLLTNDEITQFNRLKDLDKLPQSILTSKNKTTNSLLKSVYLTGCSKNIISKTLELVKSFLLKLSIYKGFSKFKEIFYSLFKLAIFLTKILRGVLISWRSVVIVLHDKLNVLPLCVYIDDAGII